MKFVQSLRNNRVTRGVLDVGDHMLRMVGLLLVLIVVGIGIVSARAKPDRQSYYWFMNQTCPKAYGNFVKAIKHAPLPQSDLFQACVNEEVSRGLH